MDKLIEAAQAFIDKLALVEPFIKDAFRFQTIHGLHYSGSNYGKELAALKEAIAAVRAHDAETDGAALITAERSRQITVEGWTPQHDDDEHESGDLARAVLCYLTCGLNQSRGVGQQKTVPLSWPWAKEWWKPSDDPVRNMVKAGALIAAEIDLQKRKAPPASHAAESAPLLPSDTLHICTACWAGNHGSCSGGKCGCVHESASVAQLDAEDQHRAAEPVEDAVERIVCHACGMAMVFRRVDTKTLETFHTCAEARKGYVKLEDVEKVIREFESKYEIVWCPPDYLITELRARLAPKPEPSQSAVIGTLRSEDFQRANACIECGTLVVHQELHAKWHAALVDRRTK